MRFFAGVYFTTNSVNFAFLKHQKLICYTGDWTYMRKVSDRSYGYVSYGDQPSSFREAPRLIEMMSDMEELDTTAYVYLDGDIRHCEKASAFLAGKGIPYNDGYSGDIEEQEKKDYVEKTFPDFCMNFKKQRVEIPKEPYQAIYCSHLAEEMYPDYLKDEKRVNPFKEMNEKLGFVVEW